MPEHDVFEARGGVSSSASLLARLSPDDAVHSQPQEGYTAGALYLRLQVNVNLLWK